MIPVLHYLPTRCDEKRTWGEEIKNNLTPLALCLLTGTVCVAVAVGTKKILNIQKFSTLESRSMQALSATIIGIALFLINYRYQRFVYHSMFPNGEKLDPSSDQEDDYLNFHEVSRKKHIQQGIATQHLTRFLENPLGQCFRGLNKDIYYFGLRELLGTTGKNREARKVIEDTIIMASNKLAEIKYLSVGDSKIQDYIIIGNLLLGGRTKIEVTLFDENFGAKSTDYIDSVKEAMELLIAVAREKNAELTITYKSSIHDITFRSCNILNASRIKDDEGFLKLAEEKLIPTGKSYGFSDIIS